MESLEKQIQAFLSIDVGNGNGHDDGNGNGEGRGYGDGFGDGNGYGDGDDYGYGYGYGDGYGHDYGNGHDDGNGEGGGHGCYGHGYGFGFSFGDGNGDGNGYGHGECIAEIEGHKVYEVDYTPTIITAVHSNVAQGYMFENNVDLVPCFVVKEANKFAHGKTLHEAYTAVQEK